MVIPADSSHQSFLPQGHDLFTLMEQPLYKADIQTFLSAQDGDMAALVAQIGPFEITTLRREDLYAALVETIAHQQLHARAAQAVLRRLKNLTAGLLPTALQLLSFNEDTLRACGFSRRKVTTLHAVAQASREGIIPDPEECKTLTDEEIRTRLVKLPGIGRWSADMLLMFSLGRPDIFPAEDFGVREGWRLLKGEARQLTPKKMAQIGEMFTPYRSVAAWYLWRRADQNKKIKLGSGSALTGKLDQG